VIFHLALASDWETARASGAYRVSTIGMSLDEVGYIHCSFADQVDVVGERFYAGRPDVLLLSIDDDRVPSEIRVENLEGGEEQFPHIYGPLPVAAVVSVEPWPGPIG
jgi:glutathione S-transferase